MVLNSSLLAPGMSELLFVHEKTAYFQMGEGISDYFGRFSKSQLYQFIWCVASTEWDLIRMQAFKKIEMWSS